MLIACSNLMYKMKCGSQFSDLIPRPVKEKEEKNNSDGRLKQKSANT